MDLDGQYDQFATCGEDDYYYEAEAESKILKREKSVLTSYIGGHLSSPIYDHECEMILKMNFRYIKCKRHRELKRFFNMKHYTNLMKDECTDPMKCVYDYVSNMKTYTEYNYLLKILIEDGSYSTLIQQMSLLTPGLDGEIITQSTISESHEKIKKYLLKQMPNLLEPFRLMKIVEEIKDNICYKEIELGKMINFRECYFEKDVMCFLCPNHGDVLGSTCQFMCGLDKIQSRFVLLLYWHMCDAINKYTTSIYSLGVRLINVFESLRSKLGNDFYSFMANWEPLVLGKIINSPLDLSFEGLYDEARKEMTDICTKHGLDFLCYSPLILPVDDYDETIRIWLEIIGIAKCFGHPTLVIEHLLDDMKNHGRDNSIEIDHNTVLKAWGIMKRDFIAEYHKKHNRLPNIDPASIPVLLKDLKKNKLPHPNLRKNYYEWSELSFFQTFEYDYSPDTSDLIKDSAAAFKAGDWSIEKDECAFYYHYNKPRPPYKGDGKKEPKRIMERYLIGTERETFDQCSINAQAMPDYQNSTAEQCGKENELKIDSGRAFTKQTYRQRLAQCSMDQNISCTYFKYVPEQTMTDPEIMNFRKTLRNVNELTGDYDLVNLDLKKWNLRFRHSLIYLFGRTLDELFGTPGLYENNHIWFLRSHIFTNSRLHPPDYDRNGDPIEGPYYYNNHLGGMEGMRQKFWTLITIVLIKLAAEEIGITISIMGQGDNQVIIIRYTKDQLFNKTELRLAFMRKLASTFESVNLKLKLQETWASRFVHEYGKVRYYKGIPMSQGTKICSRFVPDANESYPTYMSPISTINTLTESIARKDYSEIPSFLINQMMILNYLHRTKILTTRSKTLDSLFFLLIPADFGGLTVSHIFDHVVRGHDDKVTIWLQTYMSIKKYFPNVFYRISGGAQLLPSRPPTSEDKVHCLEDIFSLNIQSLKTNKKEIKEIAMEYLKSDYVTNPEVKRLYDPSSSINREDLINSLLSMKPMFLQLAHTLLRLSNEGILIALRNKFTNISSINKMIQSRFKVSFIDKLRNEMDRMRECLKMRLKHTRFRSENTKLFSDFHCSTLLAEHLRQVSWGMEFVSLTKPPPLHQVVIKPWDNLSEIEKLSAIHISCSSVMRERPFAVDYEKGNQKGYIGSTTREKVFKPSLELSSKTPLVKALKELGTIKSWMLVLKIPNLVKLLSSMIEEKKLSLNLDIDLENLGEWTAFSYGGNIFHRFFAAVERSSAIINYLPSVCTHFKQSTNFLSFTTSGGRDFTIFFQMIFVYNMYVLHSIGKLNKGLSTDSYGAIFLCKTCTKEIEDVTFDIENKETVSKDKTNYQSEQLGLRYPYSFSDMKLLVTYVTSKSLGSNVDINYDLTYIRRETNLRIDDVVTAQVSINDLRLLLFPELLYFIVLNSDHLSKAIKNHNVITVSQTLDRSLTFVAQLIIDSDLLYELFSLVPAIASEHTQLTTAPRMSNIILKIIYAHFHTLTSEKLKNLFLTLSSFVLESDTESHRLKYVNNLLLLYRSSSIFNREDYNKIRPHLEKSSSRILFHFHSALKTNLWTPSCKTYKILEKEILLYWRLHPRPTTMRRTFQLYRSQGGSIDLLDNSWEYYDSYHHTRAAYATKVGLITKIKLPTLCHMARPLGVGSSSVNKFLETILMFRMNPLISSQENIYCLADGSGGMTACFFVIYPNAKIGYNTLINMSIDDREDYSMMFPPSLVNLGAYNENRLIGQSMLMSGETNILHPKFHEKLSQLFFYNPPGLITMDAESPNMGSNIEFLMSYIPVFLKWKPTVVMWKMFFNTHLFKLITSTLITTGIDELYFWTIIKPISSSVTSMELLLVLVLKNKCPDLVQERVSYHKNYYYPGIPSYMSLEGIETECLDAYVHACSHVKLRLINSYGLTNPDILLKDLFNLPLLLGNMCSKFCVKFYQSLLNEIDLLHKEVIPEIVYPVIRELGATGSIVDRVKIILFLSIANAANGNLTNILNAYWKLDPFDLTEFRRRKYSKDMRVYCSFLPPRNFNTGDNYPLLEQWPPAKMFFRALSDYKICSCECAPKKISREHLHNFLSYRIYTGFFFGGIEHQGNYRNVFKIEDVAPIQTMPRIHPLRLE
jgi:hypothetical protein